MQRPLAVHSVQSTAWMESRRPALPEQSSERARGVLCAKRIKSFSQWLHLCLLWHRLHLAAATSRDCSAARQSSPRLFRASCIASLPRDEL